MHKSIAWTFFADDQTVFSTHINQELIARKNNTILSGPGRIYSDYGMINILPNDKQNNDN